MSPEDRRLALRMIPYGAHVLTAINPAGMAAAACTVHWVTQTSFEPPLLAVAVPATHPILAIMRATNRFALNILGKEDAGEAFTFARPGATLEGSFKDNTAKLGGWGVMWGRHGTIMLLNAVSVLECDMRAILEAGDHFPAIAEVIDAHVRIPQDGRADGMSLHMKDLGETIYYGG